MHREQGETFNLDRLFGGKLTRGPFSSKTAHQSLDGERGKTIITQDGKRTGINVQPQR